MPYHFKQPNTFKPVYKSALLYAKVDGTRKIHFNNPTDAEAWMNQLRYFRWCCRHADCSDHELRALESDHAFRAKLLPDNVVKIICNPKRLSMLIELNPWISELAIETI